MSALSVILILAGIAFYVVAEWLDWSVDVC